MKSYSKERIEIYSQERTIIVDNWKKLNAFGFRNLSSKTMTQDKGHRNQFLELIEQQKNGGHPIIPFDDIVNTSYAALAAIDSLREGKWISIR